MAKDDYFVMVYRILEYLYACFKAGEQPDREQITPEALGINAGYWTNIFESLLTEGYIRGIEMIPGPRGGVKIIDLKITERGISFLQDNSMIEKAKAALKTVKDIVPGF